MDTTILPHQERRDKPPLPATRAECRARIIQVQSDIAAIRDQIAVADMNRQATGQRMDPAWFARARSALRHKREELARMQEHLRSLPGGPEESKAQLKACIIRVVRDHFTEEQWRTVLDRAHHLLATQGGA